MYKHSKHKLICTALVNQLPVVEVISFVMLCYPYVNTLFDAQARTIQARHLESVDTPFKVGGSIPQGSTVCDVMILDAQRNGNYRLFL